MGLHLKYHRNKRTDDYATFIGKEFEKNTYNHKCHFEGCDYTFKSEFIYEQGPTSYNNCWSFWPHTNLNVSLIQHSARKNDRICNHLDTIKS